MISRVLSLVRRPAAYVREATRRVADWRRHSRYARQLEHLAPDAVIDEGVVFVGGLAHGHRGIRVEARTRIYSGCIIVTDTYISEAGVAIGAGCAFNYGCYIGGSGGVTVGDRVLVGPGVQVLSAGHEYRDLAAPIADQGLTFAAVLIEDDVWIDAGAKVLQGVTIGRHSVVAAGAVVTKDVPAEHVARGVPAVCVPISASSDCASGESDR